MSADDPRPDAAAMTDRELAEATYATLTAILDKVDAVVTEVGPAVDKLMRHPMLKMLTGGK